jgi:hypothetical protein
MVTPLRGVLLSGLTVKSVMSKAMEEPVRPFLEKSST